MTTFLTTRSMFPYIYLKGLLMLPKDYFHIIWRYEINYQFVMQRMIKCSEKRRKKERILLVLRKIVWNGSFLPTCKIYLKINISLPHSSLSFPQASQDRQSSFFLVRLVHTFFKKPCTMQQHISYFQPIQPIFLFIYLLIGILWTTNQLNAKI